MLYRHFIPCVQQLTDTQLLLGVSAVTYNPHFEHFASPDSRYEGLGAAREWPHEKALLLLDSIKPDQRQAWLQKAADHTRRVWILPSTPPLHGCVSHEACAPILPLGLPILLE